MNQESSYKPSTPRTNTTAEQAKQRASDLAAEATDEAAKLKAAGEKKVRQATESVKATTRDYAKQKKSQAASEVGVFRDAVQKAADKLSEEDHGGVAGYVSAAAEQLDRLRESIEDRNVGDLFGEAQRVARKHPEIVYGGMFVAGLALMRFLKASNDNDGADQFGDHQDGNSRPDPMRRGHQVSRDFGTPRDTRMPSRQARPTPVVSRDAVVGNPRHNA